MGLVMVGSVSAECEGSNIQVMKTAIGNQDLNYDFNGDGVVNLSDIVYYTQNSCEMIEDEEPEETIPIIEETKSGSPIDAFKQKDGSTSYIFKGHAYQLDQGVLLRWTEGYVGTVYYKDLRINIEDGVGINIKVIK
jgi:hypothetical protein